MFSRTFLAVDPCRKAPHRHIAVYRSLCQRRHRRPIAAQFLGSHPWKMLRQVMFIALKYHEIWSSLIKYHEISWSIMTYQTESDVDCTYLSYIWSNMNIGFINHLWYDHIWYEWCVRYLSYMWIRWTKYQDLWLSVHKLFKCCSLPRWSSRGKRKRGKVVYTDRTCSSSKTSELRSEIVTQNSKYAANWNILELFCSELGTCFEQKS